MSDDLALALDAVRQAAALIAPRFRVAMEVRYKGADQPVTDADLAADALLRDLLLRDRPDYGWLSEESAASPGGSGRTWMVDPIDGTNSFVDGIPEFGVSVGLVAAGAPVVGVVANPATGDVWWATSGGGAFLNGAPVRAGATGRPRSVLVSRSEQRRGRVPAFPGWTQVPWGSTAVKLCRVAQGAADAFVSFGPKHLWDVCAGDLIVREAGGRVTRLDGAPLDYSDAHAEWIGLAASRPELHDDLLRLAAARS